MRKNAVISLVVVLALSFVGTAFAGPDWEFSARHLALADTGNAVFNFPGLSPSLENIACLVGNPDYNILMEGRASGHLAYASRDKIDFEYRGLEAMAGLKTTYPTLQTDDEEEFAERLSIAFIPGVRVRYDYTRKNYTEDDDQTLGAPSIKADDEVEDSAWQPTLFQRFGMAYGINEYVAVGVGFTLMPLNIKRFAQAGVVAEDWERPKNSPFYGSDGDLQDEYTIIGPVLFSPEIGVLTRPVEFIQLGLAFEMGDMKSRKSDVEHNYTTGKKDTTTEYFVARSPSLGLGFAIDIPDIDYFTVAFDYDQEWRRGGASDYGYGADNQKQEFSVSVEKKWEMSSIKGGLGYADEVGTKRYMPYDRFLVSTGTDIWFDEHIMMGLSMRAELGYLEADPGGFAFGGGAGWTLGGTF